MTSLSGYSLAECVRCDVLLAARADGTLTTTGAELLDAHLAGCASCRLVADTLSPGADRDGDLATLPEVDPEGYALGLEVARGGMGRILAARDLRVGRPVAVKELLGRSPRLAARFEREARLTARLQHPGIVPIYEIGTWPDGTPFYSMRLVEGQTLLRAIAEAPTVGARLALLPALIAACEAVAFAHSQRVIHRDLTPSNVLVGAYGETVVIDWGLAKDLAEREPEPALPDGPVSAQLTNVGAVVGTAGYMPPEQEAGESVDERADVYALGAVLFHVLAGEAPRPGRTVDQAAPRAPRDLRSIVAKAMAPRPEARYPSARELAAELVRFQAGRLVEAHAYSRLELARRFVRRHRGAVAATLTALVLLGVIAAISVTRIVRSRAEARATLRFVLEEQGRNELLAGNTLRATAYLDEAYRRGSRSPTLEFLLGTALHELSAEERTLDCSRSVRSLDFSPDGTVVAAACRNVAKLWRLADGALLATLSAEARTGDGFDGIRFSHDGSTVATWGSDGVVRLWDARTGTRRHELVHGAEITMVTFTPDDARVASTGFDGEARIWRSADGTLARQIQVNRSFLLAHVYGVLSPNGHHLLTVTFGGQGAGFDIDTGEHLGGFVHDGTILGGELSPDGRLATTCGSNGRANVWDAATGTLVHSFAGHTDVVWKCVFDAAGTHLLTTSHDGTARVWDLTTGALVTAVTHGDIVWTGHFSPDGTRFLTVGVDEFVRVWDARTGNLLSTHETLGGADARFTPDGTRLLALRGDGRLRIWKITTGALRAAFRPPAGVIEAVTSNGARALVATGDALALWDSTAAHAIPHLPVRAPYSLGAERLAAVTDAGVAIVDVTTGGTVAVVPVPDVDAIRRLTLARDGRTLLVNADDQPPAIWRVGDAAPVKVLAAATDAALEPAGTRVLAWTAGEPVVVWDLALGRPGAVLAMPEDFEIVGFAGASRLVVLTNPGTAGQGVALWDLDHGRVLRTDADATSATLDPSGRFVTTLAVDRVVRIWSTSDGGLRTTFVSDRLQRAQVDPSGELVAAVGEYGTAALVLGVRDGRVLARWALDHDAPLVTQLDFVPPAATVSWSDDGGSIVAQSQSVAVYSTRNPLTPDELAKVKRYVPWRIVNGRVEPIRGRLRARITRQGVPVAGLAVSAVIRRPPNLAGTQYSWSLAKADVHTLGATTDEAGTFELRDLPAGEYTVAVPGLAPFDVLVSVEDRELAIDVP